MRIRHYPKTWKNTKEVMLRKPIKLDYTTIKSYRVISLLNGLGKVCEKKVADLVAEWCKINHVVHEGQMGSRRKRSEINPLTRVISKVQEAWAVKRLIHLLLVDVKRVFDHISRNYILRTMKDIDMDGNLMR